MATRLRVSCKKKHLGTKYYNHILGIGGVHESNRWYHRESQAIKYIRDKVYEYFVRVDNKEVDVIITSYTEEDGTVYEYLKTKPDGFKPNNLINLDECP